MKNLICRLSAHSGLFVGAALLAAAAQAQPLAPLAPCAAIPDEVERLACYDREAEQRQRAAATATRERSLIGNAWAFDPGTERVELSLYQPNYLLVWRRTDNVNVNPSPASGMAPLDLDENEAKFQLSFKARLFVADGRRWGLWFGYTQQSHWQVYNERISRPFRETNYMPEAMVVFDPRLDLAGLRWRLASIGYTHQSNGRSEPLSRSWNRIVGQIGVEKGDFAAILRPWIPLGDKGGGSDNPDVTDYYGYGDLNFLYKPGEHSFNLMLRGNLRTKKGAGQLSWTSPKLVGPLRAYVQAFSGYGESLIDYNWRQNTFGIGFALNDLL